MTPDDLSSSTNTFLSALTFTLLSRQCPVSSLQSVLIAINLSHVTFFFCFLFSLFSPPIAKSCQNNQSKTFSFLSQLALSSQNKFFLRSPPKFRKKAGAEQATDAPDADLVAELDGEADASEGQSPTVQYERCLSAGLDCAISDLVSLDSQAEVDQGIFFPRGRGHFKSRHGCSSTLRVPLLSF